MISNTASGRISNPIVKATLQATVLSAISNLIAQTFDAYRNARPFSINHIELLRFVVMTLITAPPNYKWQLLLERTFPGYERTNSNDVLPLTERDADRREKGSERSRKPSKTEQDFPHMEQPRPKLNIQNTLWKWFIDCMTLGALVNTTLFLVLMGILKGHGFEEIRVSVRKETLPLVVAGYKVWPFASIISFSLVPVEKRIVFLSSIGLLWGVYMSLVAARV